MCAVLTTVGGFSRSTVRHRGSLSAHHAPKRCDCADREAMRSADVSRHEAEIAIHLSRPGALDVRLLRLGRMHLMFFAGQKCIETYGAPKSADELVKHRPVMQMQVDPQTAAQ
jgi:hypothetical protein